jgi:hypothetical protein
MELQARSVEPAVRKACQDKCKTYKGSLKSIKADVDRLTEGADRDSLMGGTAAERELSRDQERRLLNTTDKLQRGKNQLEETRKQLAETEEVAIGITGELQSNREKILKSHSKVGDVSGLVSQARRVLNNMDKRERNQKMAIGGMVFFMFCCMIAIFVVMSKGSTAVTTVTTTTTTTTVATTPRP